MSIWSEEKSKHLLFQVFDQKFTIKDDYEWFLHFMLKFLHGYVTYPRSRIVP